MPLGEDKINGGYRELGRAPVRVLGSTLRFRDGAWQAGLDGVNVTIQLCSDIWFPYVRGLAHPNCRDGYFFDNVELATRHTPRLNEFLAEVAAMVRDVGARLVQVEKNIGYIRNYQAWVHDAGIRLDGPLPRLMPSELVHVDWPLRYREE